MVSASPTERKRPQHDHCQHHSPQGARFRARQRPRHQPVGGRLHHRRHHLAGRRPEPGAQLQRPRGVHARRRRAVHERSPVPVPCPHRRARAPEQGAHRGDRAVRGHRLWPQGAPPRPHRYWEGRSVTAPYYEDDQVTLYHGDCREVTEWLEADVLVTDPPYGMNFQSGHRDKKLTKIAGDEDTAVRDAVAALWGTDRPALMFGRWSVPAPAGERQRLIWHKASTPGMGDLTLPWGPNFEDIHLLGRGWDREATGLPRVGAVITTTQGRGGGVDTENKTGHPTPKPVGLMERLIERCPAGVVADPFAGSGATLLAARNLGRRSIGVELEERYCETIAARLSEPVLDLWGGEAA
nr:MAG TPA: adenine-specific methyltransferase [Caudoviricetes sp.]